MKTLTPEQRRQARAKLYEDIADGAVSIPELVRRMRHITGLSQADFARRVAGISPQALAQIEQGRGNPTVATLNAISHTFGLQVGFVRKKRR